MPATLSIPYRIYAKQLEQETLDLSNTYCPRCHGVSPEGPPLPLVLTKSTVKRNASFLQEDEHFVLWVARVLVTLALGRCPVCRGRFRILPSDILPRKLYTLPVIYLLCQLYAHWDRSLRSVAWSQSGERIPAHTTLHAWTEGMGAYALGRPAGEVPDALPADVVFTEAESRYREITEIRRNPREVAPARYRTPARRDRLRSYTVFLLCAVAIATVAPLSRLNGLVLRWRKSYGLGFRTGIQNTSLEQGDRKNMANLPPKGEMPCSILGRSPPFASNRSHHSSMND